MNSININAITPHLENPWLLLVIIPAVGIMLFPYLRIPKKRRNTPNRLISMGIHTVIIVLATLMLAGLTFTETDVIVKNDVILLVDSSASAEGSRAETNSFVRSVLDGADDDHRVGIVTFANGCVYAAELGTSPDKAYSAYVSGGEKPLADATDISAALKFSRDLLDSPADGRIIVISDGLETDGNAIATVKALADEGVRVDTVYIPAVRPKDEALIVSAEAQDTESGSEVNVSVMSTVAQTAVLKLYDNDDYISSQTVSLTGKQESFKFSHRTTDAALHVLRVELTAERDTVKENNVGYAYLRSDLSIKTLIVDGSGKGAAALSAALSGLEVTVISTSQLPSSSSELGEYGEVILLNVSNADLEAHPGFTALLTDYVKVQGGGLLVVGGDRAYKQADMEGTDFEALLPVNADTSAKSLGLLLILDSSGSMKETASGTTFTRMDLAKSAAIASVNKLHDNDYVGVISFNSTAKIVSDMYPIDRKDEIISRIRNIQTATGTKFYDALDMARNKLQTFTATELKHIIFITDGEPTDANKSAFLDLVDRIARNNITLSTIALGPSVPTDIVEEMAERGGGRFYDVSVERELESVVVEETTIAAGKYYNDEVFTPTIINHTSALAGVNELPELGGFYGTKLKEGATMVLGHKSNPIYAEWRVGAGCVGSYLSDLDGEFSTELYKSADGLRFVRNVVSGLLSRKVKGGGAVSVEFSDGNRSSRAVITAALKSGQGLAAEVVSPDGERTTVELAQASETVFVCEFPRDKYGIYTLDVVKFDTSGEESFSFYVPFSYSAEYLLPGEDVECFAFMQELSASGGGSVLFSAENLFGAEAERREVTTDPKLAFLIICIVLFLADILIRKIKIKLPEKGEAAQAA